jgi:hypothetical protein
MSSHKIELEKLKEITTTNEFKVFLARNICPTICFNEREYSLITCFFSIYGYVHEDFEKWLYKINENGIWKYYFDTYLLLENLFSMQEDNFINNVCEGLIIFFNQAKDEIDQNAFTDPWFEDDVNYSIELFSKAITINP